MTIGKANPIRPADDQELIERLRMDHPDYLTKEAADRIEQIAATCEELVKELDYTEGTNDTLIALNQALEDKLALMIFERDEVMMFERDEAWKRAAHSEKMWGEAEVKLAKAVEAMRNTLDKPRHADQSYAGLWADTMKEVRATLAELEGQ